ncbi:MAG: uroporphyrinogen decarboxylase family protein, partial [Planctomycetia bacterium]|nr:uroporphyrinogen decarboxylase family protein [Planctomycetia bacterium]
MTGKERVLLALDFEEPDRVPRYTTFWGGFLEDWHRQKGKDFSGDILDYYGIDIVVAAADETPWPTSAGVVKQEKGQLVERTGWGTVERSRDDAQFTEVLETAVPKRIDPDSLQFDDPLLDVRYEAAGHIADAHRDKQAVFAKTGGPYLRPSFIRGRENLLLDIAEDPAWTKAFVERVTEHLTAVGVESIRRFGLEDTGIWIYDDVCDMAGPIMGPKTYEKIFYPSLCRMVDAYKAAGANKVVMHCDGDVTELLEMWVAAGIGAHHPLEARCGLDPLAVKEQFAGALAITGGLDNCNILPRGNREEICRHIKGVLEAGHGGGLVIAPHTIGPD